MMTASLNTSLLFDDLAFLQQHLGQGQLIASSVNANCDCVVAPIANANCDCIGAPSLNANCDYASSPTSLRYDDHTYQIPQPISTAR
jgi:hypothetical protein